MHPEDPILEFFTYEHLPEHLKEVSKPFCDLANEIHRNYQHCHEMHVALRKLLEAKDATVRAAITKANEQ